MTRASSRVCAFSGLRVDLSAFLFGDILAVNKVDIVWVYGAGILVLAALALLWRPLLLNKEIPCTS